MGWGLPGCTSGRAEGGDTPWAACAVAQTTRQLGRKGGFPKKGAPPGWQTSNCTCDAFIKVGDEGAGTLPPRATHLIIGSRIVLRSKTAVI